MSTDAPPAQRDLLAGFPSFLQNLWQEFDAILLHLQEDAPRDEELAHLASLKRLDPEYHFLHNHQSDALPPPQLAKRMVNALIQYRESQNPYYRPMESPRFHHRDAKKSSFWLGWGL